MTDVTCAIIRNEENLVLIVQRGESTDHPFKWEFPGGKIHEGESEEECIIREISEELSVTIVICRRLDAVEHDYGHKQIRLIPFVCDTLDNEPLLAEHLAFRWIRPEILPSVDFSEADIAVAKQYMEISDPCPEATSVKVPAREMDPVAEADLQRIVTTMMSTREAEWVAVSAIENPAVFSKLFEFSLSSDQRVSFRASWTLTKVCDKFPELAYPYMPEMVEALSRLTNESVIRSFLRIISLSDLGRINSQQHGILADYCFHTLNSGFSAIAVKAYAMEILYRLTLIYPELINELAGSISLLLEDGSAGITSRGRQVMKKIGIKPKEPGSSQI